MSGRKDFRDSFMRLTTKVICDKKNKQKIVALTAYDFPFAKLLDESGIDIILVGDSVGMVSLGYETTLFVTMEDMLHHLKAVGRAVKHALLVVDMPYASYEGPEKALLNASRLIKEGGADAVKLEGGSRIMNELKALIEYDIPVMGHLGMTPQSIKELGGYKVQGKNAEEAEAIFQDALALEKAGVFSLVLECVPVSLSKRITGALKIPTIGIGAGIETDGQVLVLHDLLGFPSPVRPRFVRKYADLSAVIKKAVGDYRSDVLAGKFPNARESFE